MAEGSDEEGDEERLRQENNMDPEIKVFVDERPDVEDLRCQGRENWTEAAKKSKSMERSSQEYRNNHK